MSHDIPALCQAPAKSEMSILDNFSKKALSNPKGSLSHSIPTRVIASANEKVEKEVKKSMCCKKLIGRKRNN